MKKYLLILLQLLALNYAREVFAYSSTGYPAIDNFIIKPSTILTNVYLSASPISINIKQPTILLNNKLIFNNNETSNFELTLSKSDIALPRAELGIDIRGLLKIFGGRFGLFYNIENYVLKSDSSNIKDNTSTKFTLTTLGVDIVLDLTLDIYNFLISAGIGSELYSITPSFDNFNYSLNDASPIKEVTCYGNSGSNTQCTQQSGKYYTNSSSSSNSNTNSKISLFQNISQESMVKINSFASGRVGYSMDNKDSIMLEVRYYFDSNKSINANINKGRFSTININNIKNTTNCLQNDCASANFQSIISVATTDNTVFDTESSTIKIGNQIVIMLTYEISF